MTTPIASKPAVSYSSRDYLGVQSSLYARADQTCNEWVSRESTDFGVVMVDLLAYMADILSYQLDNAASETFLPTARRRESVVNLASLFGYRPTGRISATLTVQFTAPSDSTVTVPTGTRLVTAPLADSSPVYFETLADAVFLGAGSVGVPQNVVVPAVEGQTVDHTTEPIAISTGEPGQFYALYYQPVIDGSILIQVQDDQTQPVRTWGYVDNLVESGATDEVFSTDVTDAGVTLILFGNGVTGKIPIRGSSIMARYRIGGGVVGNVAAQTVTEFVIAVEGVSSVTNVTPGIGGQDDEDIESIRAKAPFVFAASNRAINTSDWTGLALRVPKVAKAMTVAHVYNQPVVYIAPSDGSIASIDLLSNVVNLLQPRSFPGAIVRAAAATYFYVDIAATITVWPQYSRESVRQIALQAIANLFAFNNPAGLADFGTKVGQAAIYASLGMVPGIQGVTLSVLAPRLGSGVADLVVPPEQIPQLGTPTIMATGGITTFTPTVEVVGSNPTAPTPAGAPVMSTVVPPRCDASSTHLEMTWTVGANTTLWYLEVSWLDGSSNVLQGPQLFGPYAVASVVVDVPKRTDALSMRVRTAAYNGTTGPQYSPTTSFTNPCH